MILSISVIVTSDLCPIVTSVCSPIDNERTIKVVSNLPIGLLLMGFKGKFAAIDNYV